MGGAYRPQLGCGGRAGRRQRRNRRVGRVLCAVVAAAGTSLAVVTPAVPAAASLTGESTSTELLHCAGDGTIALSQPIPAGLSTTAGTFDYSGPGECAVSGADTDDVGSSGLTTITSQGTFANGTAGLPAPCGTGSLDGAATLYVPSQTTGQVEAYTVDYHIDVANGQGVLRTVGGSDTDGAGTEFGAGYLALSPIPTTGCVSGQANDFNVSYDFTVAFNDDSGIGGPISDTCHQNGGQQVIDTTVEGVRAFVYTWQPSPTFTAVCFRAQDPSGAGAGGMVVVTPSAPTASVGLPGTDGAGSACSTTTPNAVPGTHPVSTGGVGGEFYAFDAYSNATSAAWVCVQVGSAVDTRVLLPVTASVGTPGNEVSFFPDPDTP